MKRKRKLLPPERRPSSLGARMPDLPQLSEAGTVLHPDETDQARLRYKQKRTEPRERFVITAGLPLSRRIRAYCHDPNVNISYIDFFNAAAEAYLKSRGA